MTHAVDFARRALTTALVLASGVACAPVPNRADSTVIATTGILAVSTGAPPTEQAAPLGATIQATIESLTTEGGTTSGTAAYTVTNLHPIIPSHSYTEVKGTLYAVDVTVQAQTGLTVVHPWNFALRTEDGLRAADPSTRTVGPRAP